MRRLLAHPLFLHSKRYPVLLAYVVEQTLLGHGPELKERTIGVEAFAREPNYDVNLDPVVRTTAAEVRKRLIQYYYQPEHSTEVLIELQLGSYAPTFRAPEPEVVRDAETAPAEPAPAAPIPEKPKAAAFLLRPWIVGIGLAATLLAGIGIGQLQWPKQPSNLERFWEPVASASSSVTYCLGVPVEAIDRNRNNTEDIPSGNLNVSDVVSLARSIVPMVPKNHSFRVVSATQTDFAQLREGPSVLIGAFDNPWALRISQELPFGFESADGVRKVVDRRSGQKRFWTFEWQIPNTKLAKDYAIVARIHDHVTGQPVVLLGGILGEGTEAASEVVSNPVYLNALLQKVPQNWEQHNLEAVIETQVIDGHPGPPVVVAVETW